MEKISGQQNEWISVKDNPPEINQWCLVFDEFSQFNVKKFHVGVYEGFTSFEVGACPGDYYGERSCHANYWMPLPKPPEEGL